MCCYDISSIKNYLCHVEFLFTNLVILLYNNGKTTTTKVQMHQHTFLIDTAALGSRPGERTPL